MHDNVRCGCWKLGELLDHATLDSVGDNNLIQLVYGGMLLEKSSGSQNCITFIGTGKQCPLLISTYVILYETPIFGSHYFSVGIRRSEQIKDPLKKPRWVEELHQKQPLLDLDTAVMVINSAYAAKLCFEKLVGPEDLQLRCPFYHVISCMLWCLPFPCGLFSLASLINNILAFQVSIMCGICGESSLHKHSTWSSVAMVILLGYPFRIALLFHAESACLGVQTLPMTLQTLCCLMVVWLMGVLAGFKLNTELAGLLGMISLSAIQIWSTFCGVILDGPVVLGSNY